MKLTKRLLAGVCPVAILAAPLVLSITPAFAQSTGSQEVETVVVTGERVHFTGGLESYNDVAKQQSSISQEFIKTQTAGQTFFQDLNYLPGFNFTNTDGYGTSGGNIRMHGQDGAHISVTVDGIPLNDTGNYAMYTNQMIDPEIIDRVTINQGTTDVDSPTAAVTGGTIALRTVRPLETFGLLGVVGGGSDSFQRYFGKVDTGNFGPWNTRAYLTGSFSSYDKFKGPGQETKRQINGDIYQDMGSLGWVNLAFHFNRNRNNFYTNDGYTGGGIRASDWTTDYNATCPYTAPTSGVADSTMTGCSNWYRVRVNPSDTGNIRMSSLWHLLPDLTLTADGSLQYVLANGGGTTTLSENDPSLIGATVIGGPATTTTPYGCIAGRGCDLNGDGDLLDKVQVYRPSNTNTRRWGFNTSLIYNPFEGQTFQAAYTLDYGLHRQTGQAAFFSPTTGPYDMFAGLKDPAHRVVSADGVDIRSRDRFSKAILNQAAFDYEGDWFDGVAHTSFGFRLPFFERDLNQYCYTQVGTYYVLCTTQPSSPVAANGTVTFAGNKTVYVPPASKVVRYNKFLPHLGVSFKPFGEDHQFYINYTQELAAPRTDYLYSSTGSIYTGNPITYYTAFENVKPETSTSYIVGYRFTGETVNASLALWNQQVKNRLVSSYDAVLDEYTDRNVPGINYSGVDFDTSWQATDSLWVYGSGSYTSARLLANVPLSATTTALTAGKQLSEVPKWTFAGRVQYKLFPGLNIGVGGKYVGKRFATDDNNVRVPDYFTANADVSYDLDALGMTGSSIRFNVDNMFDRKYYGSISSQTCYTGVGSCKTNPYVNPSAPRTMTVTLTARY
ncbi:MAG: TonB-dependent receptor [Alphaproteobacteria bacterium]|nr:TonB-dependent receptor [Alphaproteobacteria bacterium]MDE2110647.1 TonB-dependent receptor [Alphaproteobacteria bacterium]MDE2495076.1 TonB-dependent receptor [Alphaproteobacteria bacterium]